MITNIPIPVRTNNKVQGEFYPLQKQELIALREAKLINNTAFIHLALRYENPFCDRPVDVTTCKQKHSDLQTSRFSTHINCK